MIIRINADWRISSDPVQWIIQHRRLVKGKDHWDNLRFYRDLEKAVLWLIERQVKLLGGEYGPEALIPLHQALDSLSDEVRGALKNIKTKAEAWETLKSPKADELDRQEPD